MDPFDEVMDEDQVVEEDQGAQVDDSTPEDKGEPKETVTLESLQEKLAELEKESKGRLKIGIEERKKRQALETELNEMRGRVSQVTELISKVKEAKGKETDEAPKIDGIPVAFDEDGNPYLPKDKLNEILKATSQDVTGKVEKLEASHSQLAQREAVEKAVHGVLSSDADYPKAYQVLQNAFSMLDKGLTEIVEEEGLDPKDLTLEKALEVMEGSKKLSSEFSKRFPGLDMDSVVEAMSLNNGQVNSRKLKRALNAVKGSVGEKGQEKAKTLKVLANKPSNLGRVANQASGAGPDINDIAELDVDDFMKMSEEDIENLTKILGAD